MNVLSRVGWFPPKMFAGVLWLAGAAQLFAQIGGLDAGFTPANIQNGAQPGIVKAVVTQSDGKVIIAGDFTSIGGVARGRVARLNADGSLDTGFAAGAGADGIVNAVALQTDGKLVIGGDFLLVDNVARSRIARLTTAGALDTTFNPGTGANAAVHAVLMVNAAIHVGGDFTQINGVNRGRYAKLLSSGSIDQSFSATGANGSVYALATNGATVYVGGLSPRLMIPPAADWLN
jgi:uncharacterized delta-60 repeat protein